MKHKMLGLRAPRIINSFDSLNIKEDNGFFLLLYLLRLENLSAR